MCSCPTRPAPRNGAVVAAARLGIVLPACSLVAACNGPVYDYGPFDRSGAATGYSINKAEGEVFTDGYLPLQNKGPDPVRIVDVVFEDGEPGLELVGALVAGLDREIGLTQVLPQFPPTDAGLGPLAEADGFVIPAGGAYATMGVELLLGVRKAVPGRATRTAVLVTYEVDGDRATARFEFTLAVCDPGTEAECPHEFGDRQ